MEIVLTFTRKAPELLNYFPVLISQIVKESFLLIAESV